MKKVNEINDLHLLESDGYKIKVSDVSSYVDIISDLSNEEFIARFFTKDFELNEIIKILKNVWGFDISPKRKYNYLVYFSVYKENASRQDCEVVLEAKNKIRTPSGVEEIRELLSDRVSLNKSSTIVIKNLCLL